jgi:hypothetical protein
MQYNIKDYLLTESLSLASRSLAKQFVDTGVSKLLFVSDLPIDDVSLNIGSCPKCGISVSISRLSAEV